MASRLPGNFLKDLLILPGIILAALAALPSDTHAWSSVYETQTLGGTHHNLCRLAYQELQRDPAFLGIPFPSLQAIIEQGAVRVAAEGGMAIGLGPDDATRSAYSMHYYNPVIDRGRAPEVILSFFNALKMDLYHAPVRSGDAGVAQKASWVAHFVQDMTVPYHVLGMPVGYQLHQKNASAIIGQRVPQIRIPALLQRFENDRQKRGANADWFEAWYYDGNSQAPTKTGTHFAYEAAAMFTQPQDASGHHPYWRNTKPADLFAKEIALSTRELTERYSEATDACPTGRCAPAFDASSRVAARLLGSAVQATYSIWRASFSGLRIALSRVTPVSGQRDMYTIAVVVHNLTREAAHNAHAAMIIGSGAGSMRQVSLGSLASLQPTINSSGLMTSQPIHLPNLNERVILRLAGTFANTPDSGQTQSPANIRQHLVAQPDNKCAGYENSVRSACANGDLGRARAIAAEAERNGCRIPAALYQSCQTTPPGVAQQWIVWHPCDAKGGWWCMLNLQQTTEESITRRLKRKPIIFGKYATKREAIRATCGSITLNNVWRGGQFAACSQLSHARGGVFCVGEFVKASGSGFACKE